MTTSSNPTGSTHLTFKTPSPRSAPPDTPADTTGSKPVGPRPTPAQQIAALRAAQNSLGVRLEGVQHRVEVVDELSRERRKRTLRLIDALGSRVATDRAQLIQLEEKFEQLAERLNGTMSLNLAAAVSGFTTEQIRAILSFADESKGQITNAEFLTGVVLTLADLRAELTQNTDVTAETRGIVNDHGRRLDDIDHPDDGALARFNQRLNKTEAGFVEAMKAQDDIWHKKIQRAEILPRLRYKWHIVFPALAGAVTFLFLLAITSHANKVYGQGKNSHTQIAHLGIPWIVIDLFLSGLMFAAVWGLMRKGKIVLPEVKDSKKSKSKAKAKKAPAPKDVDTNETSANDTTQPQRALPQTPGPVRS